MFLVSLVPGPFLGHPSPRFFPRPLVLGPFWGVAQSRPEGIPLSWPGVPQDMLEVAQDSGPGQDSGIPDQDWGTPSEDRTRVPPGQDSGTPPSQTGVDLSLIRTGVTPARTRQGYPQPGQGYPSARTGVPSPARAGVPPARCGVPPSQDWVTSPAKSGLEYLQPGLLTPWPGQGYLLPRTGYAAGGMLRAVFRQEDFLIKK